MRILFSVLCLLAGSSAFAQAPVSPTQPVKKLHCVSKDGNQMSTIDFSDDMSVAQVSHKKEARVMTASLTCNRAEGQAPTPAGSTAIIECRDATMMDAGMTAVLFKTGDLYHAELSEQNIAGPKLLDILSCQ